MKILFTSDWHCDAITAGVERLPELEQYVERVYEFIDENDVELVIHAGDNWDPGSIQDARWATFIYGSFLALAERARGGLVAIPGNHDVIDSSSPLSTLSPLKAMNIRDIDVFDVPSAFVHAKTDLERVVVLALPYVSRAFERTKAYAEAYDAAFATAQTVAESGVPLVVVGHLAFEGMVPGSETIDMGRGREIPFPIEDVARLKPAVVVNGHYHERQKIRRGALDIEIVGAPLRFTFGEADGERGFLVVEV